MSKRLKDLPGFDDAMARALWLDERRRAEGYGGYPLELVGEITIPSLNRVCAATTLESLALLLMCEIERAGQRIRLLPPPRPIAANDCEGP